MPLSPQHLRPGHEQYERYYSSLAKGERVQYDYRAKSGVLFSCVAKSVDLARSRRDRWLKARGITA
ncbi:MAG: DUF3873 domain-containing protein [Anaerolineae bacterium]|nr:DUF3873 domain-containing protein [Anaerolineae bacterium]